MKYFEEAIRVELKYCERCGGLWLRGAMSGSTFCDPCKEAESMMPMKRAKVPQGVAKASSGLGTVLAFATNRVAGQLADGGLA